MRYTRAMAVKGDVVEIRISVLLNTDMSDMDALGWAGRSIEQVLRVSDGIGGLIRNDLAKRLYSTATVGCRSTSGSDQKQQA